MLLWSVLHHGMNYTEAFKEVKTKHQREKKYPRFPETSFIRRK